MMATAPRYRIMLQAGCGIVQESRLILGTWKPGMDVGELCIRLRDQGAFPNLASRSLENLVKRGFAPRYLVENERPALTLKSLLPVVSNADWTQLAFLYSARAVRLLGDFVREIYWPHYAAGNHSVSLVESRDFVRRAANEVSRERPWSEGIIARNGGDLLKSLGDFGLAEVNRTPSRRILPYSIRVTTVALLAYDLHLRGIGDNSLASHEDWGLFGLNEADVREEMKALARRDLLMIQSAGEIVRISWRYSTWEGLLNDLTQG